MVPTWTALGLRHGFSRAGKDKNHLINISLNITQTCCDRCQLREQCITMFVVTQQMGDTLKLTSKDQAFAVKFISIDNDEAKIAVSSPDEEAIIRRELLGEDMECCF